MRTFITVIVLLWATEANAEAFDRELLAEALAESAPYYLDVEEARVHVDAAIDAATDANVDPLLLLGMAYIESRYQPDTVSRKVCETIEGEEVCERVSNRWPSRKKGKFRGVYYCGVTQLEARSWRACLAWRDDIPGAYVEGANHLRWWLDTKTCQGNERCALLGYVGGVTKIKTGSKYPRWCRGRATKIRKLYEKKLNT